MSKASTMERPLQSTPNGPRDAARAAQLEAFTQEFGQEVADINVAAIEAEEKGQTQPSTQNTIQNELPAETAKRLKGDALEAFKLDRVKALHDALDDPQDRRRGLAAIYGKETVSSMSDEDVEAFIREKTNPADIENPADVERRPIVIPGAPEGFPTREQFEREVEEHGRVRLSILGRARHLLGAPGRAVWKGYSWLFDKAAKRSERYNNMTPEQQEKAKKKTAIISTIGALAIGSLAYLNKGEHLLTSDWGGSGSGSQDAEKNPTNRVRSIDDYPTIKAEANPRVGEFVYDPGRDPFNSPDRRDFDFRGPLDTSTPETAKNDLLEGWKDANPLQLATAMASFGLIPNNEASITGIAGQMADPAIMMANFDKLNTEIAGFPIELTGTQSQTYGSYSMIVDNGVQTLVYNPNVSDTQEFVIFTTPSGEKVAYGAKCGQWCNIAESVPTAAVVAAPAPTGTGVAPKPTGGGTPNVLAAVPNSPAPAGEGTPPAPVRPNAPVLPTIPGTNIPLPQIPGVTVPMPEGPPTGGPVPETGEPKEWSGGESMYDGIVPGDNGFVENTVEEGTGTSGPDLNPQTIPGAQPNQMAPGAEANPAPQIANAEASRTAADQAAQQAQQAAEQQRSAANAAESAQVENMSRPNATQEAVDDARARIGSDGRPLSTGTTGTGTGLGSGAGLGASAAPSVSGLGSSPTGGLGNTLGGGSK